MAYFLIAAAAIMRLMPHLPNFAPIAAIALFGGTYLDKKYALVIPLAAMLISDIFLGFAEFWVTISIYLSFLIIGLLGIWLRKHKNPINLIAASLTGSLLFFILTNFAVWAATGWYSKNLAGLLKCYLMAIPFFRNTVLGDLFYVAILFGLYELVNFLILRRLQWKKAKLLIYQKKISKSE